MFVNEEYERPPMSFIDCFIRFIQMDTKWRKCDFLRAIFIFKILFSFVFGFLVGISGLSGFPAVFLYIFTICAVIFTYFRSFSKIDVRRVCGDQMIPYKHGSIASLISFLISWIGGLKLTNVF